MITLIKKALGAATPNQGPVLERHDYGNAVMNVSKQAFTSSPLNQDYLDSLFKLPTRDWLIQDLLLSGNVTTLFSPGGVGKSSIALSIAISVAYGIDLLGLGVNRQACVLMVSNEETEDEIKRRLLGNLLYHEINNPCDYLHIKSGYEKPFYIARKDDQGHSIIPFTKEIIDHIRLNKIEVLIIDPFISTHDVNENDNTQIEQVMTLYRQIAKETGVAILLIHHTAKGNHFESYAGNADVGRGASAIKDAARVVTTLAKVKRDTALSAGATEEESESYIRLDIAKSNYGAMYEEPKLLKLELAALPNRDNVIVPIDPDMQFPTSTKWTAGEVAEAINFLMKSGETCAKWTDIQPIFESASGLKRTSANSARGRLSKDEHNPTTITINNQLIHMWQDKSGVKGGVVIHRKVIPSP